MDDVKAKQIESDLQGKIFSGYEVIQLLNYGKSAAVFLVNKKSKPYALKIFDRELIEEYGSAIQESRIKRELELSDHHHPNLVKLYDGGVNTDFDYHYIIMEFIQGRNLKQSLSEISTEQIGDYIEQIAKAAFFLEEKGLTHRDIKPENIMIKPDKKSVVLMDFGVIRPLTGSGLTDGDKIKPFVGTLQYSSPEFLLREEEDSPEGWRAVTFYQIGAVLHDMIMLRPIFSEYETPYAKLVNAVQSVNPAIKNDNVSNRLIKLAKCCLLKNPKSRIEMLSWEDFYKEKKEYVDAQSELKDKLKLKLLQKKVPLERVYDKPDEKSLMETLMYETLYFIKESIRSIRNDNSDIELPLCTINETGNNSIRVNFEKSEHLGIEHEISLEVFVKIIDIKERAIKVWMQTVTPIHKKLKLDAFSSIYDGDSLYTALKENLYVIFNELIEI